MIVTVVIFFGCGDSHAPQRPRRRAGSRATGWDLIVLERFWTFLSDFAFFNVFDCFGAFLDVFEWFWNVSDLGFDLGNDTRVQVL